MARLTKERRDKIQARTPYMGAVRVSKRDLDAMLDDLDAADALLAGYRGALADRTQERDDARWREDDLRKEIARLTTAFEECDKRERETQEALKAMRDENKALKNACRMMVRKYCEGGELWTDNWERLKALGIVDDNDVTEDDEERGDAD